MRVDGEQKQTLLILRLLIRWVRTERQAEDDNINFDMGSRRMKALKQKRIKIIVFIVVVIFLLFISRNYYIKNQENEKLTNTPEQNNTEKVLESKKEDMEIVQKPEAEVVEVLPDTQKENTEERSYESYREFPYETMEYVDGEALQFIKDAYINVDFFSEFEQGNVEKYNFYKMKYRQLLNNEATLIDTKNNEEVYLKDFTRNYAYDKGLENMDYSEYEFYFFDMNEDNVPELCINDNSFLYIFRYDEKTDKIILWEDCGGTWRSLMGSKTISWSWEQKYNQFIKYDTDGNMKMLVLFFDDDFWTSGKMMYMVALPIYFEGQEEKVETVIPKEVKKQGYYSQEEEVYYFSLTEEQYKELTDDFFEAVKISAKNLEEVTYTYEELFEQ